MEIIIFPSEQASDSIGALAGDAIAGLVDRKPDAVLGLATGSSPLPIYRDLISRYQAGEMSFGTTQDFTIDEYVGLEPEHPERYANVIRSEFTSHVDFANDAVHGPDGLANDIPAAC